MKDIWFWTKENDIINLAKFDCYQYEPKNYQNLSNELVFHVYARIEDQTTTIGKFQTEEAAKQYLKKIFKILNGEI